MPELPEVETVRRGLNQLTLNKEITGGDVLLDRTIAYPFSVGEFIHGIKENTISTWHRRGKYLLAELSPLSPLSPPSPHSHTGYLGAHLRMTGQLLWLHRDEPLHKHTRVRLFFGDQQELRFVDQRTFGQMWWVPPNVPVETAMTGLAKLAVDPFSPEFTVDYLVQKLQNRRRPIKTALLDQSVVAGLGNIYADEALFKSGILPETLCTNLERSQIKLLRTAIIQVLEASIAAGGTTFSNFLNVKGVNGNYGGVALVYNRTGEPCRVCGNVIQRIRLGGRSSHFCPECQH
ncbi:DNA-formamidopyrimidine glycosylase [Calothrix sp. FACHB-1219]|uniref:DNA-formamidopyrimidine glycosylase n=1 Tax=unclassified Calothrix TaxID=2619626 RepID=UPI00168A02E0|nr:MULTISPECIES: DNA-formamidopyrimidine glycosylase [unclassified Calothrix]MBD2204163.1 DNA-formamidopyrimidine glycosylase [Calothrix sp. FACHB-168]MBD2220977.1 DNA-formamidopyrimidine glycosylase [Calothrix sp. FACHB-1219]